MGRSRSRPEPKLLRKYPFYGLDGARLLVLSKPLQEVDLDLIRQAVPISLYFVRPDAGPHRAWTIDEGAKRRVDAIQIGAPVHCDEQVVAVSQSPLTGASTPETEHDFSSGCCERFFHLHDNTYVALPDMRNPIKSVCYRTKYILQLSTEWKIKYSPEWSCILCAVLFLRFDESVFAWSFVALNTCTDRD